MAIITDPPSPFPSKGQRRRLEPNRIGNFREAPTLLVEKAGFSALVDSSGRRDVGLRLRAYAFAHEINHDLNDAGKLACAVTDLTVGGFLR
jgi:hypothetical protein